MMNRLMIAKELVASIYPKCGYANIRSSCRRWGSSEYDGYSVCAGMFRSVIIPDNFDFVIKVGACRGGDVQCKREVEVWQKAIKKGVSQYFAEIYGTFRYHNHDFYVMQKVAKNYSGEEFYDLCVEGNSELEDFLDNEDINDIHNENFGFDECGNAIVFDYGSYHWGDDDEEVRMHWHS